MSYYYLYFYLLYCITAYKKIIMKTEGFYAFSLLHNLLYIYYDNGRLETQHVSAVNDMYTSTGMCTTILSSTDLDHERNTLYYMMR